MIPDELGHVPFSKTGAELLFEVVSRAYERLTGALLDRLTHLVRIIEANKPSYRFHESKRRLKQPCSLPENSGNTQPTQS